MGRILALSFDGEDRLVVLAATPQATAEILYLDGKGRLRRGATVTGDSEAKIVARKHSAQIAVADDGSVFMVGDQRPAVYRIAPDGVASRVAGSPRRGWLDGPGNTAEFRGNSDILSTAGDFLFVADQRNCAIRRVSAVSPYTVETVAGDAGRTRCAGPARDGLGDNASLAGLKNIALGPDESLVALARPDQDVAKEVHHRFVNWYRSIDSSGQTATHNWRIVRGYGRDKAPPSFDDGKIETDKTGSHVFVLDGSTLFSIVPALDEPARVRALRPQDLVSEAFARGLKIDPTALAIAPDGHAWLGTSADLLYEISPDLEIVVWALDAHSETTADGRPTYWRLGVVTDSRRAQQLPAILDQASHLAVDLSGNAYRSSGNSVVRIAPDGMTTLAAGARAIAGFRDGFGIEARFSGPSGLAFDSVSGEILIWDAGNAALRALGSDGLVSTRAFVAPAPGEDLLFNKSRAKDSDLAVDEEGTVWIGGSGNRGFKSSPSVRGLQPIAFPSSARETLAASGTLLYFKRMSEKEITEWLPNQRSAELTIPLIDGRTRSVLAAGRAGEVYSLDLAEGVLYRSVEGKQTFERLRDDLARLDDRCAAEVPSTQPGAYGLDDLAVAPDGRIFAVGRCLHVLDPQGELERTVPIRSAGP